VYEAPFRRSLYGLTMFDQFKPSPSRTSNFRFKKKIVTG
jgi:hypothetical protein